MTGRSRLPVLSLGLVAAVLVAFLVWRASAPDDIVSLPATSPSANPVSVAAPAPFTPPDPQQFAEVSARPLFRPDRRPPNVAVAPPPPPPVVAPPPAAPPMMPPAITLLGVVLSPTGVQAMVRQQGSPSVRSLKVGDDVQGWRVVIIDHQRIQLRNDKADHEVFLRPPANRRASEGVIVHPAPAVARPDPPQRLPVPLAR